MKFVALIKNGKVGQKGKWTEEKDIPSNDYDEVIEITEEEAMGEYPLEYKNGKVQIDKTKKGKIDTDKAETERIKTKVKNKEDISNTELAWLKMYGGF
jgi:DUF4097 and DUF4098 domain-containing protein YvlB